MYRELLMYRAKGGLTFQKSRLINALRGEHVVFGVCKSQGVEHASTKRY